MFVFVQKPFLLGVFSTVLIVFIVSRTITLCNVILLDEFNIWEICIVRLQWICEVFISIILSSTLNSLVRFTSISLLLSSLNSKFSCKVWFPYQIKNPQYHYHTLSHFDSNFNINYKPSFFDYLLWMFCFNRFHKDGPYFHI